MIPFPSGRSDSGAPPLWPLADDDLLLTYLKDILRLTPHGLATDIDGTISATAPTVDAAVVEPDMKRLLCDLTKHFDVVATISGRAVEDQRRMIGVPHVWHVGHHGYEWEELDADTNERRAMLLPEAAPYLSEVAIALDEIEHELAPRVPGLWMERKGITGGVHWRLSTNHDEAEQLCAPVVQRVAASHGLRARGGKLAIELFPPIIADKGQGIERLVKTHGLRTVLYFGDDVSDTDAFSAIRRLRDQGRCTGLAIGVVTADSPPVVSDGADLVVDGTEGVHRFLAWLHLHSAWHG